METTWGRGLVPSRRSVVLVGGVSLILAGTGRAMADEKAATDLVQVSGTSPFLDCTADDVADQSGMVFLNSEVEPWIDVNPTDNDNVVGIWQQDRWSNGGARGLVTGVSQDGGATWQEVVIPDITLCSGGTTTGPPTRGFRSVRTGRCTSWHCRSMTSLRRSIRVTSTTRCWPADRPMVADLERTSRSDPGSRRERVQRQAVDYADPTDADLVYAVWDRLVFPTSERANVIAGFVTQSFLGPAWFARSTDGGVTWEPAREIYDPGQGPDHRQPDRRSPRWHARRCVQRDPRRQPRRPQGNNVALLRSTDKGETWSERIFVDQLGTIFITDPDTGDDVGPVTSSEVAVDSVSGALYTVWQDARSARRVRQHRVLQSLDGGLTWSDAIKVNLTPTDVPPGNQQAFTPSVHVAADGTVG